MSAAPIHFHKRLSKIVRNHHRMSFGVAHVMGKDGLVAPRARTYNPKFPLRGLLLLIGTAFLFKAYIHAHLGAGDFDSRLAVLANGSMLEKVGAWLMQADALTVALSSLLSGFGI